VVGTLGGVVSSFSMTMVAVADLLQPAHRATAIGYIRCAHALTAMSPLWLCVAHERSCAALCMLPVHLGLGAVMPGAPGASLLHATACVSLLLCSRCINGVRAGTLFWLRAVPPSLSVC
jgi:hypothetical protein